MRREIQLHFGVTPGAAAGSLAPPAFWPNSRKTGRQQGCPLKVKTITSSDKKKKNGLTEADIVKLKKTTVNLAPQDCEKRILADNLTSAVQHKAKIAVMS